MKLNMRKNSLAPSLFAATLLLLPSLSHAHGVTRAKAAELSLHRIERLVILKKLETGFLTSLLSVEVEVLAHETEEDPTFKMSAAQVPGEEGAQKKVEIVLDEEGRPLTHVVTEGAPSINAPAWPEKNSVSLLENSLHWVLENGPKDEAIAPYNDDLVSAQLAETRNAQGEPLAQIEMTALGTEVKLRVFLKLDGTFESSELVPAP